jgi:hypothetical protein
MPTQLLAVIVTAASAATASEEPPWTLAFGSCHNQRLRAPVLSAAAALRPAVFAWLGDNVYNDINRFGGLCEPIECDSALLAAWGIFLELVAKPVRALAPRFLARTVAKVVRAHDARSGAEDVRALERHYAALARSREFVELRAATSFIATWDDHDLCRNSATGACPWFNASREVFLSFWRGAGASTARGARGGVYESCAAPARCRPSRAAPAPTAAPATRRAQVHVPDSRRDRAGDPP